MVAIDMEFPSCCYDCICCSYDEDCRYECRYECVLAGACFSPEEAKEKRRVYCPLTEIVTCKDCTYDGCAKTHSPNHFCADAERRK